VSDPISRLTHDHGELNARVLDLAAQLRAHSDGGALDDEVWKGLVDLRDQLFLHFAREEEGLFPFISEVAPDLAQHVHRMETAHDTICGALARLCHLAETDGPATIMTPLFERFQQVYADHASAEAALLHSLDRRLDGGQREHLAALVAGI
jgi:iron-sulfur cluster repair protein YtfE (RIC family)